jgi:hypothetical protein
MALNVKLQLANSVGLSELLMFDGLSHKVLVHPTIYGEPLITAQAFYYLEQLESVAEIRFEHGDAALTQEQMEYLVDNYLFEYSKLSNESKISTKLVEGKYWESDVCDFYMQYDQRNTEALVLDSLNDESVHCIKSLDPTDNIDFSDWCIVKNYSDPIFQSYLKSMSGLLNKKVSVFVSPTEDADGYMGKLRLLKPDYGLIDYYQAQEIDNLTTKDIKPGCVSVDIKSSTTETAIESIPVRHIKLEKEYSPLLLSYYFSGLKEQNYLLAFVGFYNVLEFYFEEAPILLGKQAKVEVEQIKCVVELLATCEDIENFIGTLEPSLTAKLRSNIKSSSSVEISKFAPASKTENINELGRWLYEIRCAIVHSKKTRKGKTTAIFEPYSSQSQNVAPALPFLKWLAALCIEKDHKLNNP